MRMNRCQRHGRGFLLVLGLSLVGFAQFITEIPHEIHRSWVLIRCSISQSLDDYLLGRCSRKFLATESEPKLAFAKGQRQLCDIHGPQIF